MAYRMAFQMAGEFCGVGSFNGSLPVNLSPLVNLRHCRNVPVYWAHGRDSAVLTESSLCRQLRLLHVGGFDVTLRQYPCGDELVGQVFSDFNSWMMEQIATRSDSSIVL
jgi:predicted esterase